VAKIELTRPVYEATDAEVEESLKELAASNRTYEAKKGKTAKSVVKADEGDMVVADFVGRIDGETFEGGSAEGAEIVIGSGRFIPGFEEQLKGAKAGQTVMVKVTFPEDYNVETLKGKPAEFETTVKEIRAPAEAGEVDDAFAERIGMPSVQALRDAIRGQLSGQYAAASRFKAKRALLDVLDERHDFPLPPRMVEAEFQNIWRQVEQEKAAGELSEEDKGKTDEQLQGEYRKIAERRVRLGLVLAEIGQRANVQVTDQELQGALFAEARKFPGQEREVLQYFQQNPQAAASLRAPVFEEKVVDMILGQAKVTDEPVSKEALFEEDDLPAGYGEG
ncbi:MAG: trigger factor, partial [Caulobacteraceae bacterium]|nr:trigger factor [Caulobacter sp.]